MDKKITPQERYKKKYRVQFNFDFNLKTEEDMIIYLQSLKNRTGTIKKLIRTEMERIKNEKT